MPCEPNVCTLIGGPENMKLLYDDTMAFLSKSREESFTNVRAWEALKLRVANNVASYDHAINMGAILSGQIGVTQGQQTVSPIKLAAADTQNQQPAGSVYPPIRNVDQGSAQANTGIQVALQSLADAVANIQNALASVIVTASGGASTPSQTQAKP